MRSRNSSAETRPSATLADDAALPALKNDLVLRIARDKVPCSQLPRTPCWVLRQGLLADGTKVSADPSALWDIVRSPSEAAAATVLPVQQFEFDAAILFSDLLTVVHAMGFNVKATSTGMCVVDPLRTPTDMQKLVKPLFPSSLPFVFDAIRLSRRMLDGAVPLIGFVGGPWTIAAYMIEGRGSRLLSRAKTWLYRYPTSTQYLLDRVTETLIDFAVAQISNGCQMIQVFDFYAAELSVPCFQQFALPHLQRFAKQVKQVRPDVPLIIHVRSAHHALRDLAKAGFDVISLDWSMSVQDAMRQCEGYNVAFQGNLDPCVLFGTPSTVEKEVEAMLETFSDAPVIANLGQGILPQVAKSNVKCFVEAVARQSSLHNARRGSIGAGGDGGSGDGNDGKDEVKAVAKQPTPPPAAAAASAVPSSADPRDDDALSSVVFSFMPSTLNVGSSSSTATWQRDEDIKHCTACETEFTMFVRRHHCRRCGRIYCNDCSRNRAAMAGAAGGTLARVCDRCFAAVSAVV